MYVPFQIFFCTCHYRSTLPQKFGDCAPKSDINEIRVSPFRRPASDTIMSSSPPSTIFFLRHGARLDQINSEWRFTSPTPYDPPLTANGISQARQTGLAIKSSLHPSSSRRRIIVHTSPFLTMYSDCVDTCFVIGRQSIISY